MSVTCVGVAGLAIVGGSVQLCRLVVISLVSLWGSSCACRVTVRRMRIWCINRIKKQVVKSRVDRVGSGTSISERWCFLFWHVDRILEFKGLWRNASVDHLDEKKIEEYLQKHGIDTMRDLAPKRKIVGPPKRKAMKRRANQKVHNEHLSNVLEDYDWIFHVQVCWPDRLSVVPTVSLQVNSSPLSPSSSSDQWRKLSYWIFWSDELNSVFVGFRNLWYAGQEMFWRVYIQELTQRLGSPS